MMTRELFRAQNALLETETNGQVRLTFHLMEREILGIHVPSAQRDISLITRLVTGRQPVTGGGIFWRESLCDGSHGSTTALPKVACVTLETSLMESFNVQDNLFLMRRTKRGNVFYSDRAFRAETLRRIEEFGLPFTPDQPISSLSSIEKCILEVFKAFLHGADIIIVERFSWGYTARDLKMLFSLMSRLKEEGVSFIVISDKLHNLKMCADRLAFFDGRQIVLSLENRLENDALISATYTALARAYIQERHKGGHDAGENGSVVVADPVLASLDLLRGERVAIFDPYMLLHSYLDDIAERETAAVTAGALIVGPDGDRKAGSGDKVLYADFKGYSSILESLSAQDNVHLGRHKSLKAMNLIKPVHSRLLRKEFIERFNDGELAEKASCGALTEKEKFEIYILRILLVNPKVLITCDTPRDPELNGLMEELIGEFISSGCTVCNLNVDFYDYLEAADRYVLITEDGTVSYLTLEELRNSMDA